MVSIRWNIFRYYRTQCFRWTYWINSLLDFRFVVKKYITYLHGGYAVVFSIQFLNQISEVYFQISKHVALSFHHLIFMISILESRATGWFGHLSSVFSPNACITYSCLPLLNVLNKPLRSRLIINKWGRVWTFGKKNNFSSYDGLVFGMPVPSGIR